MELNSNFHAESSFPLSISLFLIFMILKLCKVITWSWWWVTAPLWGTLVIAVLGMAVVYLIMLLSKN